MSLLEHPDAQALLADAAVTPDQVRGCQDRITSFLGRYLPRFYRVEQRTHAALVIRGLLSGLQRKTCEPIAVEAGVHRKPVQNFVGSGGWDDEAVMAELRGHVREVLGHPDAVLILDPSGFPKSGNQSCGVARQWCGRLGKQDNCQLGVFLAYAAPGGYAPLDRRLYLPEDWASDPVRRGKCHVPEAVTFKESWRIAVDLLERCRKELPHAWVSGDDEMGRPAQFRGWLRRHGERYVLDVPCNTSVRDLERRRPPRRRAGRGRKREVPFCRADAWAARQPDSRWTRLTVRDGERGPLRVDAMTVRRAGQRGAAGRAGGAPGGDADGRGEAPDRLLAEQRRPGGVAARAGPGAVHTAPDRGGVRRGEGGSRAGAVRGAELGGLAPPYDVVTVGAVVPDPGAVAGRGGKPRP